MILKSIRLFLLIFLIFNGILTATELDSLAVHPADELILTPVPPSFGLMMIQMIGMLLFLSVLLYLSLFYFKKLSAKYKNKSELSSLKIHENLYFSAKQGLSVVSFGKKVYIVGFSNNSVSLIDKIEDEEVIASLTDKTRDQKKFSDVFRGFWTKK